MKFIHFLLMFLGELALETLNIDITKNNFYSPHNTLFPIKQNTKGKTTNDSILRSPQIYNLYLSIKKI